jgi:hypothetical protein
MNHVNAAAIADMIKNIVDETLVRTFPPVKITATRSVRTRFAPSVSASWTPKG